MPMIRTAGAHRQYHLVVALAGNRGQTNAAAARARRNAATKSLSLELQPAHWHYRQCQWRQESSNPDMSK